MDSNSSGWILLTSMPRISAPSAFPVGTTSTREHLIAPRLYQTLFRHHDFRGFDDRDDSVALLQLQFVCTLASNDGIDHVLADTNGDVGHHVSENDLGNFALQLVSGADAHVCCLLIS